MAVEMQCKRFRMTHHIAHARVNMGCLQVPRTQRGIVNHCAQPGLRLGSMFYGECGTKRLSFHHTQFSHKIKCAHTTLKAVAHTVTVRTVLCNNAPQHIHAVHFFKGVVHHRDGEPIKRKRFRWGNEGNHAIQQAARSRRHLYIIQGAVVGQRSKINGFPRFRRNRRCSFSHNNT